MNRTPTLGFKSFSRVMRVAAATAAVMFGSSAAMAQADAWAGGDAQAKAMTKLFEEAKAAGQTELVIYGGYSGLFKPIWDTFSQRFPGMTIVPNPISGPRLVAKLDAEFSTGQYEGDVLMAGMTELLYNVSKERVQAFRPSNADALPARHIDPQGRFIVQFADVFGVVYNTNVVKPADLPNSLADLAGAKNKGFALDNPLAGGVATLTWIELYSSGKLDANMMRALRDNATVVPSLTPLYANLSTGSVRLMGWGSFSRYIQMKAAGSPIGFHAIPGLTVPLYGGTAILKGAPHPKAAQLFQTWFISPEAQAALITKGNSYPLSPKVPTPAEWFKLQTLVDSLKLVPPAEYTAFRAKYEEVVKEALK